MHRLDDDIIGDVHGSRRSSPLFWAEDHHQKLRQAHRAPGFALVLRPDVRHRHVDKKKKNFKRPTMAAYSEKLGSLR